MWSLGSMCSFSPYFCFPHLLIRLTCNHTAVDTHIQTPIPAVWCLERRRTRQQRERESGFSFHHPCSLLLCLLLLCSHSDFHRLLLSCHYFYLFSSSHPSLFSSPAFLPSTDIVTLLHTTLSCLKRWSHEWSLQFKSTQPSRRLKWIFCIYSCNNDSIWGYYLQTVAEFSAALIT